MLMIRLARIGKKKQPQYRLVVSEKARDTYGRALDIVGHYNPRSKVATLNQERINHWVQNGAQFSTTVHNLLVTNGAAEGKKKSASTINKKKQAKLADQKREAEEAKKAKEEEAKQAAAAKAEAATTDDAATETTPDAASDEPKAEAPAATEEAATEEKPAETEAEKPKEA